MLAKLHLAKYPFVNEAADYVRKLDLNLDTLSETVFAGPLDRAEQRLREAISAGIVSSSSQDDEIEILSYPIAALLVAALQDDRISRRYALAESKRGSDLLTRELTTVLLHIASTTFGWNINSDNAQVTDSANSFWLSVLDYLRNSIGVRDSNWKLTNRLLDRGYVRVTKDDVARLLEEEIRKRILQRTSGLKIQEPDFLKSRINCIRSFANEMLGEIRPEEIPRIVVIAAMPPCMRSLYDSVRSGKSVPHVGRFALTSFLVNVGASQEDILQIYRAASDFDERKTRYQVQHIAGSREGKKPYTPPKCSTLKTHGICVSPDKICAELRHPLTYYRMKVRSTRS